MDNLKLKESINIIYDLELNNYAMNRVISQLNNRMNKLGKKKTIPYRDKVEVEKVEYKMVPLSGVGEDFLLTAGGLSMLGVVVGVIVSIIEIVTSNDNLFWKLIAFFLALLWYGFIGFLIGFAIGTVCFLICRPFYKKEESNRIKAQKIENEKIKNEKERLHKIDVDEDQKRINRELKEKEFLKNQRDALIEKKTESTKVLLKCYNSVGLDEQYRNIVPVGYMNEFVRLGIASKLDGADGLYYLVRQELRYDQFQYTLNDISDKLDILIDNTRELYSALVQMNNKCDKMISSVANTAKLYSKGNEALNEIAKNSSITAYTTQRINEEVKFANYMTIWNSINV